MGPSGKWIDGIGPDSTVEVAAHRSLASRLDVVDYWLPRAAYLAEQDVEHVHRLRVSTRRAMAAVRLYRDWLPRKSSCWLKKRLKRIRRVAGDARDLDVLGERLAHDYGQRRAAHVVAEIEKRRAAVQPALIKVAERCRRRDRFLRKAARLVDGIQPPNDQVTQPIRFGDWAEEQLAEAAREFFAALPDESADMATLHQFRIRGKALRYTMELVAPAFGPELREEQYPEVEELQERLGKVQDHVTAAARLNEWTGVLKDATLAEACRELAAEENSRLEEELRDFREWWTAKRSEALRRGLMPETDGAAAVTPRWQAAGQK